MFFLVLRRRRSIFRKEKKTLTTSLLALFLPSITTKLNSYSYEEIPDPESDVSLPLVNQWTQDRDRGAARTHLEN